MTFLWTVVILSVVAAAALALATSVHTVRQYERGVVLRYGRLLTRVRQPGLTFLLPFRIDRLTLVNTQIVTMSVPAQDGITRDNVSVTVDAVVYFRVVDPVKAVVNVQRYLFAVSQVAQTSLRSVIGQRDLDDLLAARDRVNADLRRIIDEPTEEPWGIKIERVEVKDVSLPEGMKRSMSRQAEAERERRARVITAEGEYQASEKLAQAAHVLAREPAALQLRLLQTMVEVAAEKNNSLVLPVPIELLRFFSGGAPTALTLPDHQGVRVEESSAAKRSAPAAPNPPSPTTTVSATSGPVGPPAPARPQSAT